MNSRTSLFNKSLFKTDMKRYWWVCLAETLLMFFMTVIPVYHMCHSAMNGGYNFEWDSRPLLDTGSIAIVFVFAICVPVILMSYIHFQASVSSHHALPIKRTEMMTTKAVSSVLLISVPLILNGIVLILMRYICGFADMYVNADILRWIASGLIYSYLLASLTVFVNQMTGSPIGTLVFTVGFILLPALVIGFFEYFFDINLYGYMGEISSIADNIYIAENELFTAGHLTTYFTMIVIFTAGAYVLYRKRKLEAYGEVIAFGWLKPVFITIIAMLSSALSYLYFNSIFDAKSILWLIPIGLVGTVIAMMISRKSLSLRGSLKPILIYLGVTLAFCGAMRTDITGYERRVPDFEDIESVTVSDGHRYRYSRAVNVNGVTKEYNIRGGIDMAFTDAESIKNVRDLHVYKTKNRSDKDKYTTIPIKYKLKNGRTFERAYQVDFVEDAQYLKPIYETPQMKADMFAIADGVEKEYSSVTVSDRRINNGDVVLYPNNDTMERLIEALKTDIANASYEDFMINGGGSTVINVEYKVLYDDTNEEDYFRTATYDDSYCVRSSYTNTLAVLNELGFYSTLPTSEDIVSVNVDTWKGEFRGEADKTVAVTDSRDIKTLYGFYDSMIEDMKYSNDGEYYNIRLEYTLKTGHKFDVSCTYDYDRIPSELLKYFE